MDLFLSFIFASGQFPTLSPKRWKFNSVSTNPNALSWKRVGRQGEPGEINPPQEARSISCGPIKLAKAGGLYLSLTSAFDVSLQSLASLLQLASLLSWDNW